jgi:trehalose/maltose hydrolase-like predicted phosphorylase
MMDEVGWFGWLTLEGWTIAMDETTSLIERGPFDVARAKNYEGLFTLGSGYLHVRGSFEEGLSDARQNLTYLRRPTNVTAEQFPQTKVKWGTFVPGIYGNHPLLGKELANLPFFLELSPTIDGEILDLERSQIADYHRALSFHTATLIRSLRWITASGAQVSVRFERFVSVARPHLCLQRLVLTSDHEVQLTLRCGIDADVRTSGYDHFAQVEFKHESIDGVQCNVKLDSGDEVSERMHVRLPGADWSYHVEARRAALVTTLTLPPQHALTVEKRTAVITSFDEGAHDLSRLLSVEADYETLYKEHRDLWQDRWEKSDVIIEGDDRAQVALRLSIYHLLRSHPNDPRLAIDPKAYAGDAYRGLYFWDTEMYLLPFFLYSDPVRARMLTDFRIRTLPGARINAAEYGYPGARYPWEGDTQGIDQCPNWQYRDHEVHVTADVVYGLAHYALATGTPDYLAHEAADVIRETARYWLHRVDWRKGDGYPSLLGVMGPDEYTPISSNNAYTNRLVSLALAYAASVEQDEPMHERYLTLARSLPILRRADGLVLQCEEFEYLADMDIEVLWRDRSQPLAAQVSQERLYRSKCLKQADVLLLMALFPQEFTEEEVQRAWMYYLPYTTHDSSLSVGVHALVAVRLGLIDQALAFWQRSCEIDLNGGAEEGIHIAAAGINWQVAVLGFGGMQTAMNAEYLTLTPRLPPSWSRLAFPVTWKGQTAQIDIRPAQVIITNTSRVPLKVSLRDRVPVVPAGARLAFDCANT